MTPCTTTYCGQSPIIKEAVIMSTSDSNKINGLANFEDCHIYGYATLGAGIWVA